MRLAARAPPNLIGSKDPNALKISARRAACTLTENASSPFQAEPGHMPLLSHERLKDLVNAGPVVIYTCEAVGDYAPTSVSDNITSQMGYEAREFLSDPSFWVKHIHPEDLPRVLGEMPRLFELGFHAREYRLLHNDGTYRWMYDWLRLLRDEANNAIEIVCYSTDITECKRNTEALDKARRYAESIVETVREPLVALNQSLQVISANRSFYQTFQVLPEQTVGRFLYDLGSGQWDIVELRKLLGKVIRQNTEFQDFEVDRDFPTVGRKTMLVSGREISQIQPGKRLILLALEDITKRKRAEEKLRALTAKLISAHEDERRRLARELHDDLGQTLAAVILEMGTLQQQLPLSTDEIRSRLGIVRREVDNLAQYVHTMSHRMHPSILEDIGLEAALKSECTEFSKREKIPVKFTSQHVQHPLPNDVSLTLYRVTQESLRNIAKHAQANEIEVSITLRVIDNNILLFVTDSGGGFDQVKGKAGLGIVSMEERVRLLNGSLSIHTEPGRGTTIEVRVPLLARSV